MNSFRILAILLLFIAGTADAKQPKDVVKTVGKRFLEKIGAFQTYKFVYQTKEEKEKQTDYHTFQVAQWLQAQSSDKNPLWEVSAAKLEASMSSDFVGTICKEHKMDYVQYMKYLAKERQNFERNFATKDDLLYKGYLPRLIIQPKFMVSFQQKANIGYTGKAVYIVTLELRGAHEHNIFTITKIDEIGTCPIEGAISWELVKKNLLYLNGNVTAERERVQGYLDQQFAVGRALDEIPFNWIEATSEQYLKVEICHDGVMKPYNRSELMRWWDKFQYMWHPVEGATNHTRVGYVAGSNGKYLFQVRMLLQIGVDPNADVVEKYFRLNAEYNVHGDELWYINKFEVMCPPYSEKKTMEIHAAGITDAIGGRLELMIKSEDQRYKLVDMLEPFVMKSEINIEICILDGLEGNEMVHAKNLTDMEYRFWITEKNHTLRLLDYKLPEKIDTSAVGTKMGLEIEVRWGPIKKNVKHYSVWKFEVEWDDFLQFYHLTSAIFGCPKIDKNGKPCRFKLCNPSILLLFIAGTADAKRPKDVVKTVGKRFLEKIGVFQTIKFVKQSREERYKQIEYYTLRIARWLQAQSSDKNPPWAVFATKLEASMSSDFVGTICQEHKMNYMGYMSYLMKERQNFERNFPTKDDLLYKAILPSLAIQPKFMVSFDQKANIGYTGKAVYIVTLELRGEHEHNIYTITAIDEIGTCPKEGAIAWEIVRKPLLHLIGNVTEERNRVQEYLDQQFEVDRALDEIPFNWIQATAEQYLKSEICHDGVMKPYNRSELIRWWKKFQIMWHPVPGATNHTRVGYIAGSNGKYLFQVRMLIQIGVDPKADVVETYFKLNAEYNVHGDELWYISKFEVMCPPYSEKKIMEIHAAGITDAIGGRLAIMAKSEDQRYQVSDVLEPFVMKSEIDIEICVVVGLEGNETIKAKNLTDMDYKFWITDKNHSLRLLSYQLPEKIDMSAVGTKIRLEILVRWGPETAGVQHYSRWKFEVEWDEFLQFYHVTSAIFSCPKMEKKPCRFKICSILLLFIAGTADAKQPKDVVKTVGKRFLKKIGIFQTISFVKSSREEKEKLTEYHSFQVAQWLQAQSSDKNPLWAVSAMKLEASMSSDFVGTICQEHKMNYVQYMTYLAKERQNFERNFEIKDDLLYMYYLPRLYIQPKFMISFQQKAHIGYTGKAAYAVTLELRGEHEHNYFTITQIDEIATCPQQAAIAWEIVRKPLLHLIGNVTEERKRVQEHLEHQFEVGREIDEIPFNWIRASADQYLKSEICHDGVMKPYNRSELIRWWKKFQIMWHPVPGATNHTRVGYVAGSNGKYLFQVRMLLQIGVNPKADVVETYFRLNVEYNVHGDELWYINKFEVMCPPYSAKKTMEIHTDAIIESIGVRLGMMAKSQDQWYQVANLLDPFVMKPEIDIQTCAGLKDGIFDPNKMKRAKLLKDLDHTFWISNKNFTMKLVGYEVPTGLFPTLVAAEKMSFEIRVVWGPEERNIMHYSLWKFEVEWDAFLQFYHITSVVFACPRTEHGNRVLQLASYQSCRFKICTHIGHYLPDEDPDDYQ